MPFSVQIPCAVFLFFVIFEDPYSILTFADFSFLRFPLPPVVVLFPSSTVAFTLLLLAYAGFALLFPPAL